MNGYSEIEREKANLINATSISLEQLEKSKNETLYFEKQRAMNQVRQRVFQQAVQGALGKKRLTTSTYLLQKKACEESQETLILDFNNKK
uniref:Uncharacterized protein n=1 Tax=Aegilops tauschii subsp. strangulata TaxID=200361 RepID=A0A453NE34_AEGTS